MTDGRPTHLDLFSGIGGFALAAQWARFRTVAFCEIDKFCQKVLSKNFGAILADTSSERRQQISRSTHGNEEKDEGRGKEINHLSGSGGESGRARIYSDIFNFDGTKFRGCSLITGGFPCQPFSVCGQRRGKEDDRHLWPQMLRVINEARPAWVVGENVAGIVSMELDTVLSDLEGIGYACRPFIIPACAVDAKHRRNRVWIVANSIGNEHRQAQSRSTSAPGGIPQLDKSEHSASRKSGGTSSIRASDDRHANVADAECRERESKSLQKRRPARVGGETATKNGREGASKIAGCGGVLADPNELYAQGGNDHSTQERGKQGERQAGLQSGVNRRPQEWEVEPDVGRVAHGIPSRVDRLRGLGNAIVPQVAFEILKAIADLKHSPN